MSIRTAEDRGDRSSLRHAIEHVGHLLPMQGPIGVFIHHNTLHAYQYQPFEDAVVAASELFGSEPYMREEQFRAAVSSGRILPEDITAVLNREPNAPVLNGPDRRTLRRLMLVPGVRQLTSPPSHGSWKKAGTEFAGLAASAPRLVISSCVAPAEAISSVFSEADNGNAAH